MVTTQSPVSKNHDLIAVRELDARNSIVVHLDSSVEYRLQKTSLVIWRMLDSPLVASRLISAVAALYKLPEEDVQGDVIRFLSELYERGLITSDGLCKSQARRANARRLLDADGEIRDLLIESHIPYSAQFVLSYRCNLRCQHCYIPAMRDAMDTEEVISAINQLADLRGIYVRFTGGEPFMRKDLIKILGHARSRNFAVSINTNGFFLTEEVVDGLRNIHPIDVNISLYGHKPETHEAVTQRRGSFDTSMRAIRLLNASGVHVNINYVVMNHNAHEAEQLKAWANETGVGFRPEYSIFPKRDGDTKPLDHRVSNHQLTALMRKGIGKLPKPVLCKPASIKLRIDPDGTLHPCEMLDYALGNLKHQSLVDLWNSPAVCNFRSINIQSPQKCGRCDLKDICFRCPGMAQMEEGNMMLPSSWACRVSHMYGALINRGGLDLTSTYTALE